MMIGPKALLDWEGGTLMTTGPLQITPPLFGLSGGWNHICGNWGNGAAVLANPALGRFKLGVSLFNANFMKTTHRSIALSIPILFLFLLLSLYGHTAIARLDHQAKQSLSRQTELPATTYKAKKAGLFPRLAAKLFQQKAKPQDAQKASRRAKTGFWLFIASNTLPLVFGILLGASDPVVLAIFLSLLLASIILSIIVLVKEDNPLSRMLANIVLLLTGIGLLVSLAAYFVVLSAAD